VEGGKGVHLNRPKSKKNAKPEAAFAIAAAGRQRPASQTPCHFAGGPRYAGVERLAVVAGGFGSSARPAGCRRWRTL
jgi:hypothetical protein